MAVGKSTTARVLQALLARWPNVPKVDLVTTDGFLYPNAILEREGLMERKGFPESYDLPALLRFLSDIKAGRRPARAPIYSHLVYDVMPNQWVEIDRPDILIVEGLNVLQTGSPPKDGKAIPYVSDFFDFSIYLDADEDDLLSWYVDRFLTLRGTAFRDPKSYFHRYATLSDEEAVETATSIWTRINLAQSPREHSADAPARRSHPEEGREPPGRGSCAAQVVIAPAYAASGLRCTVASAAASRSRSSGLVRKPSMPAARQASRSSSNALAVSAMIGVRQLPRSVFDRADAASGLDAVAAGHVQVHEQEVEGRGRGVLRRATPRPRRRRWRRRSGDDRAARAATGRAGR